MESSIVNKSADVWIEESNRPYALSVQELVETGALRRLNISTELVENAIGNLMLALDGCKSDTIIAVAAIFLVMVVRRFQLRIASVLQFAENYLSGGDKKPFCWALRQWLHEDYGDGVVRHERVKLSKAVNATAILNGPQLPNASPRSVSGTRFF